MEILFFITLTLLIVAMVFVWKFWRERNAYRTAYCSAMECLKSTSQPYGLIPAIAKGLLAGALVGLFLKMLSRIREGSANE